MTRRLTAEFVGTFALVFAGTGAIAADALTGAVGHVGIALAFGLVIAVMVYAFKDVSGAHFNPAVTIALWSRGDHRPREVVPYLLAEIAGAVAASLVLLALVRPLGGADLGATLPARVLVAAGPRAAVLGTVTIEALATFFLVTVIFGVVRAGDGANPWAGVAIGGTVALDALAFGTLTGASMNPARSLGPAFVVPGALDQVWLYIVGPIAGALVAAAVDRVIRGRRETGA